jgi:hypothetical protein
MEAKQEQPVTTDFLDSEAQAADPQLYTQLSSSKNPPSSTGTFLISNRIPEADYISFTEGEAGKEETLCKSQVLRLEVREQKREQMIA